MTRPPAIKPRSSSNEAILRTLLRQGTSIKRERLKAADMITVEKAAALIGTDRSTIIEMIDNGRCIGAANALGTLRLPRWQFDAAVWPHVQAIAERLDTKDGWILLSFLETSLRSLNGLAPRIALERGVALERLLAAADADSH